VVRSEDEPLPGDELSQDEDGEQSQDDEDEQPTRRFTSVGPAGSSSGRLVVAEYEPTFGGTVRSVSDEDTDPGELRHGAESDDGDMPLGGLLEHYEILEQLGHGGMGVVYAALDRKLDRKVAIKRLLSRGTAEHQRRLIDEARAMAKLAHPNVVQVYEIGETNGATFIVMEYVAGLTLRRWLERNQNHPPERILDLLIQAGRGLEAAHAAGLVHRDFKPENVIVGDDGRVRVLDFGLVLDATASRALLDVAGSDSSVPERVGKQGAIIGTPSYMALEQWSGLACTPATDQYAFCVVAHEALYGIRPFVAEHFWQLLDKITNAELTPIPADTKVAEHIHRVLSRGLAGAPEQRWPSLSALLSALDAPPGVIDFSAERGRHEHLFGRDEILAELDAQLAQRERGWLLLTGGPGLGKSAILNRWLSLRGLGSGASRLGSAAGLTAFHFIRRNHKNWADPEAIRANLAAQVEAMFPEQRDPNATSEDRLERVLARVSPVLAQTGQKLVLLVDGLDEAMELGRGNPVPMMFPLELPAQVFVFAASRPRYPHLNWFHRRTGGVHHIDLDALAAANERAVREYWNRVAPGMSSPPSRELIEAAIRGAQGNLQHAVKLAEVWTRQLERSLDDVPEGFEGLIGGLLERVGELPKRERQVIWDGLVLLCAARESLSLAVMEELLEWDEGDGDDEFLPFARELLMEEQGPAGPSYRLFHERLSERVERARPRLVRSHHASLASWSDYWATGPLTGDEFRRTYALDHRVAHLIAAGEPERAAATCMEVGFLAAKAIRRGVFEVESEVRSAAKAQTDDALGRQLATLARMVGACAHWARGEPEALPALLHDRVLTNAPKLMSQLRWPPELASQPRLVHPLQCSDMARVLRGQQGWVVALVVLPGGRVASGSGDKIQIWDVESGRTVSSLEGHRLPVTALAVLPDGRLISASTNDAIYVWPSDPEQPRRALVSSETGCAVEFPGTVTVLAPLSDGRLIGGDDTLYVWDIETGRVLVELRGHEEPVTTLGVLADGRVVVGDDDRLLIWDVERGQVQATLTGGDEAITSLIVIPGERVVTGTEDGTLRIWDLRTGESRPFADRHAARVTALVSGPGGRVVSSSFDKTLRIWDVEQARAVAKIRNHQTAVIALAALPDGRVASGCADNTVRVLDLDNALAESGSGGHDDRVCALAVLPDGNIVSGSQDRTLRVWSRETGQTQIAFEAHEQRIGALAVLPDGRIVSGSDDMTVRVWSDHGMPGQPQPLVTLRGHEHHVTALAVLADGRVVSGSQDSTLRIWQVESACCQLTLEGHASLVTAIVQLPDGRVLSSAQDRSLRVWDPESGRQLRVIDELRDYITALALLPDGRVVSGGQDNLIHVWDLDAGRTVETFEGHRHPVTALAVLPDGRIASSSRDHTVRIWAVGQAQALALVHADAQVFTVAAPSAQQLVAGDALGNVWFLGVGAR
jgi:WD40 repeat protein/serine/threonine protein kinase